MTEGPVRLRVHVSEPFDFERENGTPDVIGTTVDHHDPDADEWLIELEDWYTFNGEDYDEMLISPRYVGEHPSRVFDSFVGFPIRIAHRTSEGWHFAMTGMLSPAPPPPQEEPGGPEEKRI